MSIETLTDLRKELKKINCKVSIRQVGTLGKFAFYSCNGKEIKGNVFSHEFLDSIQPLISFLNQNEETLLKMGKRENIHSLAKI